MNNFGLGLILDFTDNASAGMSSAARTLENLSATADQVSASLDNSSIEMYAIAQSMIQVGDTMSSAGAGILSVFTTLGKKVIDTGMTMQNFRMTLSALYGQNEAEAKIKEIQDYAATSVFEIEGLMSAVTTMKAVGIEAMNDVTTSTGNTTQKLMDYASDLAAMMPTMRNAYGTGVNAAMGAFKEYISEGNAMSLKRGAGLDITSILGEDKGATVEKRTQQVADLIEKLGIAGYTAQLYGTPMQQISNISDVFFNVMSQIADSGVFDTFCELLSTAAGFLQTLTGDEERFAIITQLLGDVISTLMRPLQKVLNFVIDNADAMLQWAQANPTLAKTVMLVVAAIGALLLGGGQLLKLSGTVLMLATSIKYLGGMNKVLTVLGTGFKSLLGKMLPIVAIAGVLVYAWKTNLLGFRDFVQTTFGEIGTLFSLTFDALSDNTLSQENFELAQRLGLLPFIESLLDLKYHWGRLVEGFKQGISDVSEWLTGLGIDFGNTEGGIFGIANAIGEFFKQFFNVAEGSADAWENFGNAVAKVLAIAAGIWAAFKVLTVIVSVVTKIIGISKVVINVVKTIVTIVKTVGAVVSAIAAALNLPVIAVVAIIAAIVALVAVIIKYKDQIWAFLQQVPSWIYNNIIVPVVNFFINGINFIVGLFAPLIGAIKNFFAPIAEWISVNVITPVVEFFTNLWTSITEIVNSIITSIQEFFAPIAEWIDVNVIQPIVTFFTGLITSIGDVFSQIKEKICNAFSEAADFVKGIWEGVKDFFGVIWGNISGLASGITDKGSKITGLQTIPAAATGVDSFVGGLIQVNENGGELIDLPGGSTVIPHDQSVAAALERGVSIGAKSLALYANNSNRGSLSQNTAEKAAERNEYNISFQAGSVIVKCANTSDAELEKTAEKLLKIIKRKIELKKMAERNTKKPVYA